MTPGNPNPKAVALLLLCAAPITAQTARKPTPQRNITVVVVDAHAQPAQPVPTVRVSLSYLDNGTRVTDAREVTNRSGEAYLTVSTDAAQRGDLRIEISGVSDLVIYQPADGQLSGLPGRITLNLLPKGSPALLGPAQIEATLRRALAQITSLRNQNRTLQSQLAGAQSRTPDLTAALAEIAHAYGFPPDDFDKQVQGWALDVQRRAGAATTQQQALAELALQHYSNAAKLFTSAADLHRQQFEQQKQQRDSLLAATRTSLRQYLQDTRQSAHALTLDSRYHEATQTLLEARNYIAAQRGQPEDEAIHAMWLEAVRSVADARTMEAGFQVDKVALPLLAESISDYKGLAREFQAIHSSDDEADVQVMLGAAFIFESAHTSGENFRPVVNAAVQAEEQAVAIYGSNTSSQEFADAEMYLGSAYMVASQNGAASPLDWLDKSIAAFRLAMKVYNRSDFPDEWAYANDNLATALARRAQEGPKQEAPRLIQEAIERSRESVAYFTQQGSREGRGFALFFLGGILSFDASISPSDQVPELLREAEQDLTGALTTLTRQSYPYLWEAINEVLAGIHAGLGDFATSASEASAVLEVNPNSINMLRILHDAYHDNLFQYDQALSIDQRLIQLSPTNENKLNLMESDLTAGRFDLCTQDAAKFAATHFSPMGHVTYDTITLACQWAAGHRGDASATGRRLLAEAGSVHPDGWDFPGTLHYLDSSPSFANGRASWMALFTSVQNGYAPGVTIALHQLGPLLQP